VLVLVKNTVALPAGETVPLGVSWTIVVPVPWTLPIGWALAALLKFEMSTSPGAINPPGGKP
jgi:hypothetical protein